jgi:putative flippase GtrA
MPHKYIISFIDFFYPPFKRWVPLKTFRYAVCGGSNVASTFIVFTAIFLVVRHLNRVDLVFVQMRPHSFALFLSSFYSFCFGFVLNKYVVFVDSNLRGKVQLFRYFLAFLLSLSLNYILLRVGVEILHLKVVLTQFFATIIVILVSYLVQTHFTFKVKEIID